MSTKHTPGPWILTGNAGQVYGLDSRKVSDCGNCAVNLENHANARLIAAAPELLGALKSALRALEDNLSPGPMDEDAKTAARLAIAKATA